MRYDDTSSNQVQIVSDNTSAGRILLTRVPLPHPWAYDGMRTGYERWKVTRSALHGGSMETLEERFDTTEEAIEAAIEAWGSKEDSEKKPVNEPEKVSSAGSTSQTMQLALGLQAFGFDKRSRGAARAMRALLELKRQ